jgi:hypothetical protein
MRSIHEAARDASPETPAAEVRRADARRADMVINDEGRKVTAPRPRRKQAVVHLFVFAGKQACRTGRSQVFGVGSDAAEHIAADHCVPTLQNAGKVRTVISGDRAGVDSAEHRQVLGGNPVWWWRPPTRDVRAADEVDRRILKRAKNLLEPRRINFLVVVDHSDQVTTGCRNAGVQRARLATSPFEHHLDAAAVPG